MNLLIGEVQKTWIETKRYWFSTITDIFFYYILFMIIFFYTKNLKSINPASFDQEVSRLLIGYISWFFFSLTLSFISNGIYSEMVTGTFEQLYLTGSPMECIMFIKFLVYSIKNLIIMLPFAVILIISTGISLNLSIEMLFIFLIIIMGILGFSYLLAGLTIRFKNTGQLAFIISAIFLGTSLVNLDFLNEKMKRFGYIFPFVKGQDILKQLAVESITIDASTYIFLISNGVVYLLLGLTFFKMFFKSTKAKGMLIRY